MKSDLIIAGGGIIGLYSAYVLAQHGIKLTLIDKGEFGQESSWAAGGILTTLLPWNYSADVNIFTEDAAKSYENLANVLFSATGIDIEFWNCGLTVVNEKNMTAMSKWCASHNYKCKTDLTQSRSRLFLPDVSQLRTPRLLQGLLTYLQQQGVNLISNTTVSKCLIENQRIIGIETSRGTIKTNNLLWATGAWASQLSTLDNSIDMPTVTPVLGQMIAMQGENLSLDQIYFDNGHYIIPRKDGMALAGSTLEYVGYNKSLTKSARDELWKKSIALVPELGKTTVTHQWSGLRPGSNGNIPTVKPHPDIKGLFLNFGHFRYGVAMAPWSAKTIANHILEDC